MLYEDFMAKIEKSSASDWIYDDELGLYIFKGDIDISIQRDREWQLTGEDQYCHDSWATNNVDPKAYMRRYYLKYRGNIIDSIVGASVDGLRCFIPYPTVKGNTISKFEHSVGEIINNYINEGRDYKYYLENAKITVK